jgi:hypothetical protein
VQIEGCVAGGVMLLGSATLGPRLVRRVWREPQYAEIMARSGRVLPFGYATSRGVTRGALPLWVGVGLIGAGTIAASALPGRAAPAAPVSAALIAAIAGYAAGLAAIGLNLSIVWFSRPRRLVPPHMRGDEGLASAWWRCRNLPPAQRRAAARARRRWPAPGAQAPGARDASAAGPHRGLG